MSRARFLGLALVTVSVGAAPPPPAACLLWDGGSPLHLTFGPRGLSCVSVSITEVQATKLIIDQPVDLRIKVSGPQGEWVTDGFEFGPESITLDYPGSYQIVVEPIAPPPPDRSTSLSITVGLVTGGQGATVRLAEQLSTSAKATGRAEDFHQAYLQWMKAGDELAMARTLLSEGEAMVASGDHSRALQVFQSALEKCERLPDEHCAAAAANDGGWTAHQLSNFDDARILLARAIRGWELLGEQVLLGQTLSNAGMLYRQIGDYQEAIRYYDRATLLLKDRDRVANARVLNNLGVCYQFLGELDKAKRYFDAAIAGYASQEASRDLTRARLNLGRNSLLQGYLSRAHALLDLTLTDAAKLKDRATHADALAVLGPVLLKEGHVTEAEQSLADAIEEHRQLGDRRMEAQDLFYAAEVQQALGRIPAAREKLIRSYEIRRASGLRDTSLDSLLALARLEVDAGDHEPARRYAEQAESLLELVRARVPGPELRAAYTARRQKLRDLLVEVETKDRSPNGTERAFLASDRGHARVLTDLVAGRQESEQAPASLIERRRRLQHRIDLLVSRGTNAGTKSPDATRREMESVLLEEERLAANFTQSVAGQVRLLGSVAELQRNLPSGSALLEYYLGADRSFMWLVRSNSIQIFELPSRGRLEDLCRPLLALLPAWNERRRSQPLERQFQGALREAGKVLLGPLGDQLAQLKVILVTDGILTQLPFAALPLRRDRHSA